MLSLEVRKKNGEAEVRRVSGPLVTIGASSGNQVVVRAIGVAGRHARIVEKDNGYFLDVFRGVDPVAVNGRESQGCPISIGDRITIGEATITLLSGRPSSRVTPLPEQAVMAEGGGAAEGVSRATPPGATAAAPSPLSEADYRGLRLDLFRRLKRSAEPEEAAGELLAFLAQELGLGDWAVMYLTSDGSLEPIATAGSPEFQIPSRAADDLRRAMGPLRMEDGGDSPLLLVASPGRTGDRRLVLAAHETTRLPQRALSLLEEAAQMADLAWQARPAAAAEAPAPTPRRAAPPPPVGEIIAVSDPMRRLVLDLPRIGRSVAPVLIMGEVGTGKDLIAAAIHQQSAVAEGPYIVVDCSAMGRIEEEIFGRPGAGRGGRRPGKIEEAAGGTLVLNEIGFLPQAAQAKLFEVMSSEDAGPGRVRWIGTTSSNLLPAVETGTFRRDLYFRLAVLTVRIPPLTERREDIPALFEHFVRRHAPQAIGALSPDALNALLTYRYPGNVRELENEVIRLAAILAPNEPVALDRLDTKFREAEAGVMLHETDDLKKIVESVERHVIDRVMRKVEGNQSRGAELLNISRGSLIAKVAEYGIRDYRYLRRERRRTTAE